MRNPVHRIVHPSVLKQLSLGCEVLGFQAIESIMASAAFLYRNGKRVWNVAHEPDSSVEHLAIDGDMPAEFGSIRAARFAQQKLDDADQDFVFEVPVDLAAQIAGYRYDENSAITFRKLRAA